MKELGGSCGWQCGACLFLVADKKAALCALTGSEHRQRRPHWRSDQAGFNQCSPDCVHVSVTITIKIHTHTSHYSLHTTYVRGRQFIVPTFQTKKPGLRESTRLVPVTQRREVEETGLNDSLRDWGTSSFLELLELSQPPFSANVSREQE